MLIKNLAAFKRYRAIDNLLKDGGRATKDQLKAACNDAFLDLDEKADIKDSTLEHDLTYMKSGYYNNKEAPIKKEKNGPYYYSEIGFTFFDTNLSDDDIKALKLANDIFSKHSDIPLLLQFSEAITKIINKEIFPELAENTTAVDLEFPKNIRGDEFIPILYEAITKKRVLKISYQKYSEFETKDFVVHPYLLKEYAKRWYLIGAIHETNNIRSFGLDMIESVGFNKLPFQNSDINWKDHFKDSIGIFVFTGEPVEVKLSVESIIAHYILNQPLHHSQKIVEINDYRCVISITVHPTPELKGEILKWGQNIEVLSPVLLREEIRREYENALKVYYNERAPDELI